MTVACGSRAAGEAVKTCVVRRAAPRLARPGLAFASCTTIGRLSAAGGQVGGHGDVAAEPDDDLGLDALEHRRGRGDGLAHARRACGAASRFDPARQRHRRDELERVPARRDERGVEALERCPAR